MRIPIRAAVLVAVTAIAVTACGGGDKKNAQVKPASVVATTTTDPQQAQRAAVLQAWRDYWNTYLDMGTKGTPFDPRLKDFATGKALDESRAALDYRSHRDEVYRGTYDLNPTVLSLTADSASVRDCSFDHTEIYNTRTSLVDHPAAKSRYLLTGTLTLEGGRWKLATMEVGGPCSQ